MLRSAYRFPSSHASSNEPLLRFAADKECDEEMDAKVIIAEIALL